MRRVRPAPAIRILPFVMLVLLQGCGGGSDTPAPSAQGAFTSTEVAAPTNSTGSTVTTANTPTAGTTGTTVSTANTGTTGSSGTVTATGAGTGTAGSAGKPFTTVPASAPSPSTATDGTVPTLITGSVPTLTPGSVPSLTTSAGTPAPAVVVPVDGGGQTTLPALLQGGSTAACTILSGSSVVGQDANRTFLGRIVNALDSTSIFNLQGQFGSQIGQDSIWNAFSPFGSESGPFSAFNRSTSTPPVIFNAQGVFQGFLSENANIPNAISPVLLRRVCASLQFF